MKELKKHIVLEYEFLFHLITETSNIIMYIVGINCTLGRTEKTKILKLTKFRVKFHVSIHRYGVHGLKKVILVNFG